MKNATTHTPQEIVNKLKEDYNKGAYLFVEEYKTYIERIAVKYLERKSPNDINIILSDVLNDVIVKKGIFKLTAPEGLKSWLYVITRNKVRSFQRKQCNLRTKHEKYSEESETATAYDFPYPDKEDVKTVLGIMSKTAYNKGAVLLVEHLSNDMTYDQLAVAFSVKRHRVFTEIQKAKKEFIRIYNETKI